MTIASRFQNFLSDFRHESIEWALGMFKPEPISKKYTPCGSNQVVEVIFEDESVFRFVEKVRKP